MQLEEEVCAEMTARIDSKTTWSRACNAASAGSWTYASGPTCAGLRCSTPRLYWAGRNGGASLPGPVETVGSMLFAAIIAAALTIIDPAATRARVEPTLYLLSTRVLLGIGPASIGEP